MIARNRILYAGTPFAVAALLMTLGCGSDPKEAPPEVARPAKIFVVRDAGAGAARVFPGQVRASRRVPLAFRVGGPVTEVLVNKGQRVAEGELLARIDPRDYDVQVKNLEAQLASAEAQHKQAVDEYQRVRGLYQHDNASRSDFDRARASVDVGQAQVEATEQALRASRLARSDTDLRAPFDGVVADRLVDSYQVVAAGLPVLLFQDMRGVEVGIDVPERQVAELTRTKPRNILVSFDALPREEFPAHVREFATEADPETQTFLVTLRLDHMPQTDLLSGMTASVSWVTANGDHAGGPIAVPLACVVRDENDAAYVWQVGADSRVSRTAVVTGALTDDGIEILSGLSAGDRILAAGAHFVREGQLVRAMDG